MISCNNIPSVSSVWVVLHAKGLFCNIFCHNFKVKRLTK